ncbi:MAG TPA: hypothetical protein EYP98_14385 [Planctomycetes bacterium]|nr:hypothetical protein [Planctomycetota bacterium]
MLRHALAAVLLFSIPTAVIAQSDASTGTQQDPQAAYQKLAKSFAKAMSVWQDELQATIKKAQEAGERVPRSAYAPPTKEFVGTAQELAQEHAGKDTAVPFLGFILKNASRERNAVKWAVKTLASDHAESKAIGDIVDYLPKVARMAGRSSKSLLNDIADNHSDNTVRAKALLARARQSAANDKSVAAVADLEQVKKLTTDQDLLDEVKEALVETQKLAVGSVAPEIDGVDIDGVKFKLSDYRGKVVLLDFWGFW